MIKQMTTILFDILNKDIDDISMGWFLMIIGMAFMPFTLLWIFLLDNPFLDLLPTLVFVIGFLIEFSRITKKK